MDNRNELEDLVRYDVDQNVHQSLEEQVEHAVALLAAHAVWLREQGTESVEL
jgi:hypothetical protein